MDIIDHLHFEGKDLLDTLIMLFGIEEINIALEYRLISIKHDIVTLIIN